jgi:dolichol-phosphate mannosyltransferase
MVPLRIAIVQGLCFLILAAGEVLWVAGLWLSGRGHLLVPGWSSLMFMLLLVGGILMIGVGFVGLYVGYIFQEVKRRPVYVVRSRRGREPGDRSPAG